MHDPVVVVVHSRPDKTKINVESALGWAPTVGNLVAGEMSLSHRARPGAAPKELLSPSRHGLSHSSERSVCQVLSPHTTAATANSADARGIGAVARSDQSGPRPSSPSSS